jgi:hypothetical protein
MSVRIVKNEAKVAYVVAAAVISTLAVVLGGLGGGMPVASLLGTGLVVAAVVFAVRVFRDANEPITPARAWWRMTARPTSGFVLGILFLVNAGSLIATASSLDREITIVPGIVYAVFAIAFLYSSIRLTRSPALSVR